MAQKMFSSQNNQILLLVILGAIVFFMIVMPWINSSCNNDISKAAESFNNTNVSTQPGLIYNRMCKAQCCIPNLNTMWPVPQELVPTGDMTADELAQLVPTNFTCNNGGPDGGPGGCPCVTKDDIEILQNFGGNLMQSTCKS